MPTKLKALLVLLAVSILMNVATGLSGSLSGWLGALINVILFLGVVRGKEGARNLLMMLAGIGLMFSIFAVLVGILALASAPNPLGGIVVLFAAAFALGQNGFCLWCLRQPDVQHWMYQKSLGAMAG
jgi:hypothetical protein